MSKANENLIAFSPETLGGWFWTCVISMLTAVFGVIRFIKNERDKLSESMTEIKENMNKTTIEFTEMRGELKVLETKIIHTQNGIDEIKNLLNERK